MYWILTTLSKNIFLYEDPKYGLGLTENLYEAKLFETEQDAKDWYSGQSIKIKTPIMPYQVSSNTKIRTTIIEE